MKCNGILSGVEGMKRLVRIAAFVLAFLALAMAWPASAGEDAPERKKKPEDKGAHRFWDRPNLAGLAVHAAARTVDLHSSCRAFARGREEKRLPLIASCRQVAAYSYSVVGLELGLRYWLHRRRHHKWERWLPYFFATPAGIEAGFNYRF